MPIIVKRRTFKEEIPEEIKGKSVPFFLKGLRETLPFAKKVTDRPGATPYIPWETIEKMQPEGIGQSLAQGLGELTGSLPAIIPLTSGLGTVGGLAAYGALEPAESLQERLGSAAQGALFGGVLRAVGAIPNIGNIPILKQLPRAATGAAAFGIPTKISGAPTHEVAAQSLLGGALSFPTPLETREVPKTIPKPEIKPEIKPKIEPKAEKYANNINLDILPQDLKKPIAQFITDKPEVGKTPRITNEQTLQRMSEIRETPSMKYFRDLPEGTLAAETTKIARGELSTIRDILSKDLGPEGLKTELDTNISRALEVYRRAGSDPARAIQARYRLLQIREDIVSQLDSRIKQYKNDPLFKDNKAIVEKLQNLKKVVGGKEFNPNVWDKAYFVWLNSILSDPRTHAVNIGSNTLFALAKIPEKFVQALVDLPISAVTGKRSAYFGEIPAMVRGLISKEKVPVPAGSKFEELSFGKGIGKILPTELLKVEDIFGKQLVGKMEKYARAYRKGVEMRKLGKKGLTGGEEIRAEQLYRTFQNEPGRIARALMSARRKAPFVRWIIPFIKTPANIIDRAIERTPGGIIGLRKGMSQADLSLRLGNIAMGSVMSAWVADQVIKGNIVGEAPVDKNERDAFFRSGKQPNAIRIGNHWIPFERLEPLGTSMSLIANIVQNYRNAEQDIPYEKVLGAVLPLGSTLLNKTYFQGMTNLVKALSDPEIYGATWGRRIAAGMFSPGLLNYIAQLEDPYIRQPSTVKETVMSRLPGLSKQVMPRRDVYGEPIKRATPALPIRISRVKEGNLDTELNRLGKTVTFPAKTIGKQKLSSEEYSQYLKESGSKIKNVLNTIIKTPLYQSLSDDEKVDIFDKVIKETRKKPRYKASLRQANKDLAKIKTEEKRMEYINKLPQITKILTLSKRRTVIKRRVR